MTYIYKVGHIINNELKKIYVFYGSKTGQDNKTLNKLFIDDPENIAFSDIFSPEEINTINKSSTLVIFVNDYIHLDDTIETIKKKIMMHTDIKASFGELYLFAKKYENINSISTYQTLTQNEKQDLTKNRLVQYLLNIDEINIDIIDDKEIYTYEDILSLGLDNKPFLINNPIGQTFLAVNSQLPYTINPFDVVSYDSFLEKYAEDITTTTNKNILMNTGKIYNNMMY